MGNSKSHQLKEEYINKKFVFVKNTNDELLGNYNLIDFKNFKKECSMRKIINPQDYDRFADINEFVKNLSKTDKRICDFYFVEFNQENPDMFDLIFEYGSPIDDNIVKNEKELLSLIKCIIKAFTFLQNNNMHYPVLHKKFIINKSTTKYYKLINPYCFKNYLKEVLEIYMNPMNNVTLKNEYCQKETQRNVREFGKLLISLLNKFDEQKLYKDENYLNGCLITINSCPKTFMINLINYIFDKKNPPKDFKTIGKWYKTNHSKEGSMIKSLLSNLNFLNKDKKEEVEVQIENTILNQNEDKSDKKKNYTIFGDNEQKNLRNRTPLLSPKEVGIQMQKELFTDQKEDFIQYRNKMNEMRKESEDEKKRNYSLNTEQKDKLPRTSTPDKINFDNVEELFFKEKIMNNNFFPDQSIRTTHFDIMQGVDFFEEEENIKKKISRKKSLNKTPLMFDEQNHIEFLNQNIKPETNITNYLKTKEKRKSNLALNDMESYYINEMDAAPKKQDDLKFAKYMKNEYDAKSVVIEKKQSETSANSVFLKKKTSEENRTNKITEVKNDFQPPKQTKAIKKVMLKWIKEEAKYQKTIEYVDGSTEIVEINDQENDKYKNSIQNFNRTPEAPPKTEQKQKLPTPSIPYNFLLFPNECLPPILLFSSSRNLNNTDFYKSITTIVDREVRIKASRYHMVEHEGIELSFAPQLKSLEEIHQRHIKKAYYEK